MEGGLGMVEVFIDPAKIEEAMWASNGTAEQLEDIARRLNEAAAAVFTAEEVKTNEERLSETTPPKYIESFKVVRNELPGGRFSFLAVNDDPGALWVEVGAHAGGRTRVLKYRPYGRAMDALRIT